MQGKRSKLLGLSLGLGLAATAATAQANTGVCASVAEGDRGSDLIEGKSDRVEHVQTLKRTARIGKMTYEQPAGVRLFVRPAPGLSVPYLQRAVECALAQHAGTATAGDPLAAKDVKATVRAAQHHFVVDLVGSSHATARGLTERVVARPSEAQVASSR